MNDKDAERPLIIDSSAEEEQKPSAGGRLGTVLKLLLFVVFTVVLVLVGLLIYANAYDIDGKALIQNIFTGKWNAAGQMLQISETAEPGTAVKFADIPVSDAGNRYYECDGQLYIVNGSLISRLDKQGDVDSEYKIDMDNACVSKAGDRLLVYNVGGSELVSVADGVFTPWSVDGKIIRAYLNTDGYTAVTVETEGYRSVVELYDAKNSCIAQRYINYDYVLWAGISPSSNMYIINRVNMDEIKIVTWIEYNSTKESAPTASVSEFDALAVTGVFCADDTYAAVADNSVKYYSTDGTVIFEKDIDTIYDICTSENNDAVMSVREDDGTLMGKNKIYLLRGASSPITEIEPALPGKTVSVCDGKICVNTGSYVYVYDFAGTLVQSYKSETAVEDAVMMSGSEYMVITGGEILKVKL